MRILYQNGPRGMLRGGATQQIDLLIDQLRPYGVVGEFDASYGADLSRFDLVHLNHLNLFWTPHHYRNCRRHRRPFVVKCIWHVISGWEDYSEAANAARDSAALTMESPAERDQVFEHLATRLTSAEMDRVVAKTSMMMPGVDPVMGDDGAARTLVHINGRYDDRKGMREVIEACRDLGMPVVTAGFVSDNAYFERCRSLRYGQVLGEVDKRGLRDIYNRTKVYVCNSVRELNSTSVNEAIACGCLVLSTENHLANTCFPAAGYRTFAAGELRAGLAELYYSGERQENTFWTAARLAEEYLKLYQKAVRFVTFM